MMISPRDVVVMGYCVTESDGTTYIVGKSVVDPAFPEAKGFVRAEVHVYAWVLKPVKDDPNKTKLIRLLESDPKGSIPKMVVNKVAKNEALVVANMIKLMDGRKK